jgi:hypothetical protein
MIRPPSLMSGSSFCVRKNTPLKMDIVERVQFSFRGFLDAVVVRDAGVVDEIVEPHGPKCRVCLPHFLHEIVECTHVLGVELQSNSFLPCLPHQANDLFGLCPI